VILTAFRRSLALAAIACWSVFPSCASSRGSRLSSQPGDAPVLTAEYVLAPPGAAADVELKELARSNDPAPTLRRAWLLLEQKQTQAALDLCAEVLYAREGPSPAAEALARYLRAVAFEREGLHERAAYDRERARELAFDPQLRARLDADSPSPHTHPSAAVMPLAGLALQRRASWNPMPLIAGRLDPMERIFRLTVHHSGEYFRDTSPSACAAHIQKIQHEHIADRNWGDIGYHFVIDPAGRVWEGRDLRWQGAHARGDNNRGNIGICVLGNFVRGKDGQRPTEPQLAALRQLISELTNRYAIKPAQIYSHRDFVQTECPGPYLAEVVAEIAHSLRTAEAPSGATLPVADHRR
jgi:hypothetical protein